MDKGVLAGLRVLDLTDQRGVLTGRMLACMGAVDCPRHGPI